MGILIRKFFLQKAGELNATQMFVAKASHICTLAHFHICTLAHFHTCTSAHLKKMHLPQLAHRHISTFPHSSIRTSAHLKEMHLPQLAHRHISTFTHSIQSQLPKFPPNRIAYLFTILLIFSLTGCAFDDDTRFVPKTRASFFRVQDSVTQEYSLLKLENQTLTPDWNTTCGVNSQGLSAVQINTRGLWLADIQNKKLLLTNPADGSKEMEWKMDAWFPHYFMPGKKYILVSDTATSKSIFAWAKKDKLHDTKFQPGPPRNCIYNAGKFYLLKGCCSVSVISEDAGVEIFSFTTTDTLTELGMNAYFYIYVFGQGSSGKVIYGIDPNTNLISPPNPQSYDRAELSPWFRTTFGREYLDLVSIKDTVLNVPGFPHFANAFSCDFFNSMLYYQWQDSLYSYDLISKTDAGAWPMAGKKLIKGYYWLGSND